MGYRSIFRPDAFRDQVVIVTGAGSGIGRCTAHELAALGAQVVLVGRTREKLDEVEKEIREDGGKASIQVCDIRDEVTVASAVDRVLADHGRIDGLVNNAGGQFQSPLQDISTRGFEAVVRNNLVGGFIVMREVFNRWMGAHGGSIVNITMDAWHGLPLYGHSGAARSGMNSLTETAAAEWASAGVRVNAVAPGVIASSGFDTYPEEAWARIRTMADKIPLGRFGQEAEVSAAIVFLLSPAAAFITGTCVRVDGGAPNARQTLELRRPQRTSPFQGFHRAKATRQ